MVCQNCFRCACLAETEIYSKTTVSEQMQRQAEELAKQGKHRFVFATEEKLCIIMVADVIKEDSPQRTFASEYGN